ncbi:RHS repeat-associated core domain-containing protein [Stenotrophomonas cyclobalanopsidis]|uniref:RHS repeat-associated core domain-containing protein n=1 Tax=Stenotrophomonas cyclobalanopsidis TaxID=2771362 RepID=UPI00346004A1
MASEHFFRPAAVICAWIYGVVLLGLLWAGSAAAQTVTYIHTDALGSVVAETDANGNVIKRYDHEPYGAVVGGGVTDGPGYTGHVSDLATGLSYMQQRYMDPQLGVFLSVDPVTAYEQPVGQFNRYRYANGNPYKFTDPDGRQACVLRTTCTPGQSNSAISDFQLEGEGRTSRWLRAWRGSVAHRVIQDDISQNLPGRIVQKERRVKTGGANGRLDLMVLGRDGVWSVFEIKPASQMPLPGLRSPANAQLSRYVQGLKDEGLKAKVGNWAELFPGDESRWVNAAPMRWGGALLGGSYVYGPSDVGSDSGVIYYSDGPNAVLNVLD